MASTGETFLPWSSPFHSSHWIGRSTSGLRPYCCHRGGTAVHAFSLSSWPLVNSFWINKWYKNSQNKSWKWLTARRTIHNYLYTNSTANLSMRGSLRLTPIRHFTVTCMKLRAPVPVRAHDRVHTITCSCCHYSLAISHYSMLLLSLQSCYLSL